MSLRKNTLWNLFGSASPMIIGVVAVPFLLERIGAERLGILTIIWALIGYFSVFDFGLGRALTLQVANLRAQEENNHLIGTVKTGLALMLVFGLGSAAFLATAMFYLQLHWLNLSNYLYDETYYAVLVAIFGIPIATLTSGFKGILEGFEEFKLVNILRFILGVANFALPVASVLFYGPSLLKIVLCLIFARTIVLIAHLFLTIRTLKHNINLPNVLFISAKPNTFQLIHFGAWMTLSNIISPLMVMADRFVVSHFWGATMIAYYTVPFDFLLRLLILPAALTTALFPRMAFTYETNKAHADRLFVKSLKIIALTMFPICLLISILSYRGLALWLGPMFAEKSYLVTSIIAIGVFFNSVAQVPYVMIQAAGDVRKTSIIHLMEFLLYAPILFIAVIKFELIGVAIAWSSRALFDFIVLHIYARRILRS